MSDWSDEETDDPLYKVEKWNRDWLRVELMLYAGNSLAEPGDIREHDQASPGIR